MSTIGLAIPTQMQEKTSGSIHHCIVSNFKWVICWTLFFKVGYCAFSSIYLLNPLKQFHVIPCHSLGHITAHQNTYIH